MSQSKGNAPGAAGPYLLVVAAGIAAWLIYTKTDPGTLIVDADEFAVFAPFYVVAQAIERLLEPLALRWKRTDDKKAKLRAANESKQLLESPATPDPSAEQLKAADAGISTALLALESIKADRAIYLWALASVFGLLACACLGLGLVSAVSSKPPSGEFVRTVDVLLTGLAIGAGTKPLHDLISRLEKAKENADPATP